MTLRVGNHRRNRLRRYFGKSDEGLPDEIGETRKYPGNEHEKEQHRDPLALGKVKSAQTKIGKEDRHEGGGQMRDAREHDHPDDE